MNTKILDRFANRLKELRKEKDITQEQLAIKTHVHPTYISKIETAKRNPTLKMIYLISRALGVSLHELFEFDK